MIYLILILYSYPIPKLKSSILIFHRQICLLKYYSIKMGLSMSHSKHLASTQHKTKQKGKSMTS